MTIEKAMQVLELGKPFGTQELKSAYRQALLVWHPDRFPGNQELRAKATVKTRDINEAYSILKSTLDNPEAKSFAQRTESTPQHRRYARDDTAGKNSQPPPPPSAAAGPEKGHSTTIETRLFGDCVSKAIGWLIGLYVLIYAGALINRFVRDTQKVERTAHVSIDTSRLPKIQPPLVAKKPEEGTFVTLPNLSAGWGKTDVHTSDTGEFFTPEVVASSQGSKIGVPGQPAISATDSSSPTFSPKAIVQTDSISSNIQESIPSKISPSIPKTQLIDDLAGNTFRVPERDYSRLSSMRRDALQERDNPVNVAPELARRRKAWFEEERYLLKELAKKHNSRRGDFSARLKRHAEEAAAINPYWYPTVNQDAFARELQNLGIRESVR